MLKSTFVHIEGIGKKKELSLWKSGITTWEKYIVKYGVQLSLFKNEPASNISRSIDAYEKGDIDFFAKCFPKSDYYRIALEYPEEVIFLDIETTGLSLYYDELTIVGWSVGKKYGVYIRGGDDSGLRDALKKAKIIVTFNGTIFDIKFLKKTFNDLQIPPIHIDLRFFARHAGLSGGQKKIEAEIGFKRDSNVLDMTGESAPVLWHQYKNGDNEALKTLIIYNHSDVEGMKYILDETISRIFCFEKYPKEIITNIKFSKNKSKISWTKKKSASHNRVFLPDFQGDNKPSITYYQLNRLICLDDITIIGVDLVSSEEKESGFCVLKGNKAKVCRIKSDKEIIELALASDATLISIDSPLSLPVGRTTVFDDDKGRQEFGIMRCCERELKKRGINVYPCLIPSMQKLTKRGMELAKKFRKLGIPVIESYPGAAQDIMSIPRKHAGLIHLTSGIKNFGIDIEFPVKEISHDELDAITSAIVGHFFWSGMYEALGNKEEKYLIIPDMKADTNAWLKRRVIGFIGSKKEDLDSVTSFFRKKGYKPYTVKGLLNVLNANTTCSGTKDNHCKIIKDKVLNNLEKIVINGVKTREDHALLKELFGPAYNLYRICGECDNQVDTDLVNKAINLGTADQLTKGWKQ